MKKHSSSASTAIEEETSFEVPESPLLRIIRVEIDENPEDDDFYSKYKRNPFFRAQINILIEYPSYNVK